MMKYFRPDEFECKCGDCRKCTIDPELAQKLDTAREIAGIPFYINSGVRCSKHNADVGGAKGSSHLTGKAADIRADTGKKYFAILRGLIGAGFTRIGLGGNYIHVDVDKAKPQDTVWRYAF